MDTSFLSFGAMFFGGFLLYAIRHVVGGIYTLDQNERAVVTAWGRADRLPTTTLDHPMAESLRPDEKDRYNYPLVRVVQPGGLRFRFPWEKVYKVSVAVQTMDMARDLEDPTANRGGSVLEAVTKDQLNTGLVGQIRYRVSEQNLYAALFGVKQPLIHVMGYFISILRERIANFDVPEMQKSASTTQEAASAGVSINDLRKNLRSINETMDRETQSSVARFGIQLDASLITAIEPPHEVESALAAINTAHNQVSSEVSLAQAGADQKLVQSRRAVEIETLNAQAEVEPLQKLAYQLSELKKMGPDVLKAYVRNVRLGVFGKADQALLEVRK